MSPAGSWDKHDQDHQLNAAVQIDITSEPGLIPWK